MTSTAKSAFKTETPPETTAEPVFRPLFVNWPGGNDQLPSADLLDGTDFSPFEVVFFDPLQFARHHHFCDDVEEFQEAAYASFDEREFLAYLGKVKHAQKGLKQLLSNNGILVVRSNLPRCFIRVRKRSSAGTRQYTESVVSAFFWLEELIGHASFSPINSRTIRFLIDKTPLRRQFGECAVNCRQVLENTTGGKVQVIAGTGSTFRAPAITVVSLASDQGQVFFVPEFLVKDEQERLLAAFLEVHRGGTTGSARPRWLTYYETELTTYSPYRSTLDMIEAEQDRLAKRKAALLRDQEQYSGLVDLLFESGEELEQACRTALDILGFKCAEHPAGKRRAIFEAALPEDKARVLVVRVAATDDHPVPKTELETLQAAAARRTSAIKAKPMLLGNAYRRFRPEGREHWFEPDCHDQARKGEICLMPSLVLFTAALYIMSRLDSENILELKASMRRDIFDSDCQFELNRRKYAV